MSGGAGRTKRGDGVPDVHRLWTTLRIGHGEFVDAHPTATIRETRQMADKPHSPAAAGDDQPCALAASHIRRSKI